MWLRLGRNCGSAPASTSIRGLSVKQQLRGKCGPATHSWGLRCGLDGGSLVEEKVHWRLEVV